jgi:hypothetical protein
VFSREHKIIPDTETPPVAGERDDVDVGIEIRALDTYRDLRRHFQCNPIAALWPT